MFPVTNPKNRNEIFRVQIVLECRQKAGTYGIGQETVGAAKSGKKLDVLFKNNELEWYTKESVGIFIYGLLVRILKCDSRKKVKKAL